MSDDVPSPALVLDKQPNVDEDPGAPLIAGAAGQLPVMPALSATRVRLGTVWRDGAPFFVALLLLSVLQYLERFVASAQLDANELGRYVFVWSIANAVQTGASATVVAVAAPRLVSALDSTRAAAPAFRAELARALRGSRLQTGAARGGRGKGETKKIRQEHPRPQ